MAVNLTAEQQARIDVAGKRVQDLANAYNAAAARASDWESSVNECSALRDQKNTSIGKNNACHIDTLNYRRDMWNSAIGDRDSIAAQYEAAKQAYSAVLEAIAKENALAADALKNDPQFQKDTQANIIKANELQNEAQRDKNKKIILIVAIILLVGIIGFSVYLLSKKKN